MPKKKSSSMKVRVPGSSKSIEKMKYEIANEFGVNLGGNASSRDNGLVGGEITKRLVENGMNKSNSNSKSQSNGNSSKSKKTNKRSKKSSK